MPPTVLVVDDERTVLDTLGAALEREGYRVLTAAADPPRSRSGGGTWLGLANARHIAEAHRCIWARAEEGCRLGVQRRASRRGDVS